MSRYRKLECCFLAFCLLALEVRSLSNNNAGAVAKYQRSAQGSATVQTITTLRNESVNRNPPQKQYGVPYTIFYRLTYPQSRGGKNLNLTVVSDQVQARILNRPELYPYFSQLAFKEETTANTSSQQRFDVKKEPITTNLSPIIKQTKGPSTDTTRSREDAPEKNSRQPKSQRFSSPPRISQVPVIPAPPKTSNFPGAIPVSGIHKVKNFGIYKQAPPHLYDSIVRGDYPPPFEQKINLQNWPCFCVPYYLCKNGFINSGGRSVASIRRRTRSARYNLRRNDTYRQPSIQAKVMNAFVIEQVADPSLCEENKVCCRLSFTDDVVDDVDDRYYPVATPPPDPPRYPDDPEICGIRKAYGIQGRLQQLQYTADVAEFGEYPWQVAVLRKVEGQKSLYLCGGVLISSLWVATAAHCVQKEVLSPLLIRLGEWDVNRKDEVYPYVEKDVDTVVLHPDFHADTLYNDLALILMRSPVNPHLPHITPACLPRRENIYHGYKCWVSGWGKDFFGPQGEYQNVLKEVDVPVIGRNLCNEQLQKTNLGPNFILHPGFLCAGGEAGKDACTGDGGSPLVCEGDQTWHVVGLVSWGIGCGQPGVPGMYVNMLYYMDWINSIIWRQ